MKLGSALFAAFFVIFTLALAYPLAMVATRMRLAYLESAEDPLVDTANLLASFVGHAAEQNALDIDELYQIFEGAYAREVDAQVYEMVKARVDLDVYITDAQGFLIFDSRNRHNLGQDYSHWRDVRRTLNGQYGARVGRHPDDKSGDLSAPALLYVAAPVWVNNRIAGALTVVKPTTNINAFVQANLPRLFGVGAISAVVALLASLLVSLWVTQQVGRLTRYANDVHDGVRVAFPKLARTELLTMGRAFERMRAALAGQAYVENYVRALTHELKSPISAIQGAAEILENPHLTPEQRTRFLSNIQSENRRLQNFVDRMLELSGLEARRALPTKRAVALAPILRAVLDNQADNLQRKQLTQDVRLQENVTLLGDPLLLELAFSNVVQNAMDFSPQSGCLAVRLFTQDGHAVVQILDDGPGIPSYAQERVFERFFSLERPDTHKKSTGLGLNLVREIAALHHGTVELANRTEGGLLATLRLPEAGLAVVGGRSQAVAPSEP